MRNREPTEESFLKDVAKHEMKVLKDDGIYRHLRFASTGQHSWNQWFEIVTFPGKLVYSGDMGTYVFARLEDMFQFFRTDRKDEHLGINLSYWGEKLEAVNRNSGYQEYNPELVREAVKEHVDEWLNDNNLSKEDVIALREALEEDINYDDGQHEAYRTISGFSHKIGEDAYWRQDTKSLVASKTPKFATFEFQDIFEWRWEDYTYHYIWCCYAIAYAIKQYDNPKLQFETTAEQDKV